MTRKIEQRVAAAFERGESRTLSPHDAIVVWEIGNARVSTYRLWSTTLAALTPEQQLLICREGWDSRTTLSRINALLPRALRCGTRKGEVEWRLSNGKTMPFAGDRVYLIAGDIPWPLPERHLQKAVEALLP